MRKFYTFILALLLSGLTPTFAQLGNGWDSAFNFGGAGTSVSEMRYDASGNLFFTATVMGKNLFAGTQIDPGGFGSYPSSEVIYGKIATDGTQTLLKRIKNAGGGSLDVEGNLIMVLSAGFPTAPVDFGNGIINNTNGAKLLKISNLGVTQWMKNIDTGSDILSGTSGKPAMSLIGIQTTPDGNLFISIAANNPSRNPPTTQFTNPHRIIKFNANGDEVWHTELFSAGFMAAITVPKLFVDDAGRVTFGIYSTTNQWYYNGEAITTQMGTYTTGAVSAYSIVISLNEDGSKKTSIADTSTNAAVTFTGLNPINGNLYINYGVFAAKGSAIPPFNTLPNQNFFQPDFLFRYGGTLLFNTSGQYVEQVTGTLPFPNTARSGNKFVSVVPQTANVVYEKADYIFNSATSGSILEFFDQDFNFVKALSVPTTSSTALFQNKATISGEFKTTLTFGTKTLTASFNDTDFGTRFPFFASLKADMFIATADAAVIAPPVAVTWKGVDNNWNNIANWSNGKVPDASTIVKFNANTAQQPTLANTPAVLKVIIDAGVTASLPADLVIKNKLIINGTLQINHSGALNFTNYSATAIEGAGTLAFNGTSVPSVNSYSLVGFKDLSLSTNENITLSTATFKNITFTGTNAIITAFTGLEITNPSVNAITGQSATNYIAGKITRAINANGVYVFPNKQSNFAPYEPTTLTLNNLTGTTKITVANDNGATQPNLNFATGTCTNQLGDYYWRITPDVAPTGGTYGVSFQKSEFTNGVTIADRYVVLKRIANGSPWTFEGTKTVSTQSGGTVSGTAPNEKVTNATVSAGLTGLSKFSDFTIGINSTAVATNTTVATSTWTGVANTEWNNVGNWSAGIPNATIDAVIPSGLSNYPAVYTGIDNAKSLTIAAGVTNMKISYFLRLTNGLINNTNLEFVKLLGYGATFNGYGGGISGSGKLIFNSGLVSRIVGGVINNDIDIDLGNTIYSNMTLLGKIGGNINVISGSVFSDESGGVTLELTNPNSTITIAAPINHIAGIVYKSVNTTGTYNFPIGTLDGRYSGIRNYGEITITNKNIAANTVYAVSFNSRSTVPVSVKVGSDAYSSFINSGQWYVSPTSFSTTGTLDLTLKTSNYTNGSVNITDYGLLRRVGNNWVIVDGATFTETNGTITASATGLAPFSTNAIFCIGLKAKTTQWTGATDTDWATETNWNNGVPNQTIKAQIIAGAPRYPLVATGNNAALLEIGTGVNMKLPIDFNAGLGVVNNGTLEVVGTGTFNGFDFNRSPLSGTGKLLFTDNSPENISGDYAVGQTINNGLEINRTGGVKTSYNMVIGGDLNLVNGLVTTSNELKLSNADANITGTAQSYVVGTLNRKVKTNGVYSFPVGSATAYAPVNLTLNNIVGVQNIKAGFSSTANTTAPVISIDGRIIDKTLDNGVWTIEPDYGQKPTAGSYDVNLQTNNYTNGVTDADLYNIIKRTYSFFPWEFLGNTPTATQTGGTVNGVVVANGLINAAIKGLTSFSEFAIGIRQEGALPINLVSFKADKTNAGVKLNWLTDGEKNSAYFEVQKSTDGINFTSIGKIEAAGNSAQNKYYSLTDFIPAKGINYYRLNQIDLNGKAVLSNIIAINFDLGSNAITVYPNPAVNELHFTGLKTGGVISLFNIEGKKVFSQKAIDNAIQIPTSVKSGLYIMNIKANDGSAKTLKVSITK